MKNLNLSKRLSRDEMRTVFAGKANIGIEDNCVGGVSQCTSTCAQRSLNGWICSDCCVAK